MTSTPAPTTPTASAARRRMARLAAAVLAAGTAFTGVAGTALADSPPAPPPGPQIAVPGPGPLLDLDLQNAPAGPNTKQVSNIESKAGDTWADITFRANTPTVTVQFSTTKPYVKDGKPTVGAVSPVALHGTPVPGNPQHKTKEKQWSFSFSPAGLTPHTTYYTLFTIHGPVAGQQPNHNSAVTVTKTRYVRMTATKARIIDDADHGLRGKGEIAFTGARVAPDGDPSGYSSSWPGFAGEYKLSDGDSVDLTGKGLAQTRETRRNSVVVQVQGRENDVDPGNYCAIEGGDWKPEQFSDECYDWSVAEATAFLPTGRYQGAHVQWVKAKVQRSPALRFEVDVLVETWYV